MSAKLHKHEYKAKRSNATVLICDCGRFQNVISERNPAIVGIEAAPQHTPTPRLYVESIGTLGPNQPKRFYIEKIENSKPKEVAKFSDAIDVQERNFIVRAVNAHEELIEALKRFLKSQPDCYWVDPKVQCHNAPEQSPCNRCFAQQAIARAERGARP